MIYDVIIVGAGPAGLSAGIYAARYDLKILIISQLPGGLATTAHLVENYPGFLKINGIELMNKFKKQAETFGAKTMVAEVLDIQKKGRTFQVITSDTKKHSAKSVILALGSVRRKLNVPGEDDLLGKGISYCATCDAAFFKNKEVVVIGGSDTALKGALVLKDHAKKVTIIYRKDKLRGEPMMRKRVLSSKKVSVIYNNSPVKIKGKNKVESIIIQEVNTKKKTKLKTDGVFIEVGDIPSTSLAKRIGVKVNKEDYIIVDKDMKTSLPGFFAAGDVTNETNFKQIITAASQGSKSAYSCYMFLNSGKIKKTNCNS